MRKPRLTHVGICLLTLGITLGQSLTVGRSPAHAQVSAQQPPALAQQGPVRPPTKEVTLPIEGEPQVFEFTLFQQDRFPVSTYYPATRMVQRAQCRQEGCVLEFAARTAEGQADPDAVLMSFFFPQSRLVRGQFLADIQEKYVTGPGGILSRNPDWELLSTHNGPFADPWTRRSFMFRTPTQIGVIQIAKHQDRFFLVMERLQGDYGDGYSPLMSQIYRELRFETVQTRGAVAPNLLANAPGINVDRVEYTIAESDADPALESAIRKALPANALTQGGDPIRYYYNRVDLNQDGQWDAVVYLTGGNLCTASGCPVMIFQFDRQQYFFQSQLPKMIQPPILVSEGQGRWMDLVYADRQGDTPIYRRLAYIRGVYSEESMDFTALSGEAILADHLDLNPGLLLPLKP